MDICTTPTARLYILIVAVNVLSQYIYILYNNCGLNKESFGVQYILLYEQVEGLKQCSIVC